MMKKRIVVLLAAMCMVLSLAACGGKAPETAAPAPETTAAQNGETKAPETQAPETQAPAPKAAEGSSKSASGEADSDVYVDMWSAFGKDNAIGAWLIERMAEYEKIYEEETGLSLTMELVPQDNYYIGVAEKLTTGAASKVLPVMATLEESYLGAYYPICTDLAPLLGEEQINAYTDGMLASCKYNDTMYAAPFGRSCIVFYVNTDLVEQVGWKAEDIDTWDDLHQVALLISQLGDEYEGFTFYWDSDVWGFESALYSNGGTIDNEDGTKITFADNGTGAAYISLLKEMLLDGSAFNTYDYELESQWDAMYGTFMNQKLGIMMCSSGMNGNIRNAFADGAYERFNCKPIPQPAGLGGHSVVTGGSNLIVCSTATETQKEAAAGFLKYIAEDENAVSFAKTSGYFVTTKAGYESEYMADLIEQDPTVLDLLDSLQYAHQRPTTPYFREMHSYLTEQFIKFSNYPEESDPETLVQEWADYCQSILDDALN